MVEMIPFERQFQTLHSLQNYFLLNELLAPGWPMPLVDTDERRRARARRSSNASASGPITSSGQPTHRCCMDEVEKVL